MLPFLCGKNAAEEQALCREVQEAVESGRVTAELREKLGLPGNERVATGLLRTWAQDGTIARLIEDVQAGQVRGEMERRRVDSRGRGAMIGTTGEGGKGYGEGTQWKGIDPFGRKTILYDSGRWKYGKGAGEQAGGLDKSARTGRYSSIQDRRRINYDGLRRNGVQEQQIDNFRYMEITVRDLPPELRAIREQNFGRGIETVFVLDEWIVGQRTQDGTEIKGFVSHFVDRIIGQQAANDIPMPGMRRGVAIEDALEALRNPVSVGQIQMSSNGLKSVTYEGRNCIARVNPDTGMLIQCNPN